MGVVIEMAAIVIVIIFLLFFFRRDESHIQDGIDGMRQDLAKMTEAINKLVDRMGEVNATTETETETNRESKSSETQYNTEAIPRDSQASSSTEEA